MTSVRFEQWHAYLQEAARAARRRGQGRRLEQAFLAGAEADGDVSRQQPSAEDVEAAAEQQYAAELAAEVQVGHASERARTFMFYNLVLFGS